MPELQLEEEHYEMFEQINTQVTQTVDDMFPELEYNIIPLSSEDSYIYRILVIFVPFCSADSELLNGIKTIETR